MVKVAAGPRDGLSRTCMDRPDFVVRDKAVGIVWSPGISHAGAGASSAAALGPTPFHAPEVGPRPSPFSAETVDRN
jgi:hypothetical protein